MKASLIFSGFLAVGCLLLTSCSDRNFDFTETKDGEIIRTDKKTGDVSIIRNGRIVASSNELARLSTKTFSDNIPQLGNIKFTIALRPPNEKGIAKGLINLSPRNAELIIAESKSKTSITKPAGFRLSLIDANNISLEKIHLSLGPGAGWRSAQIVDEKGNSSGYSWDVEISIDATTFSNITGLRSLWYGFE